MHIKVCSGLAFKDKYFCKSSYNQGQMEHYINEMLTSAPKVLVKESNIIKRS
jgi:hypothetical protein